MKKLMLVIASLFLATSVANASPIQSDLDLAFGGAVKTQQVTLLNDTQMSNIKGKGWGRSFSRAFKRAKRYVYKHRRQVALQTVGVGLYFYTGGACHPSANGFSCGWGI
jgi:hypothetical protein